jgi:hypothetical protein
MRSHFITCLKNRLFCRLSFVIILTILLVPVNREEPYGRLRHPGFEPVMERIALQNYLSALTGDAAGRNIMAFTKKRQGL